MPSSPNDAIMLPIPLMRPVSELRACALPRTAGCSDSSVAMADVMMLFGPPTKHPMKHTRTAIASFDSDAEWNESSIRTMESRIMKEATTTKKKNRKSDTRYKVWNGIIDVTITGDNQMTHRMPVDHHTRWTECQRRTRSVSFRRHIAMTTSSRLLAMNIFLKESRVTRKTYKRHIDTITVVAVASGRPCQWLSKYSTKR